LNLKRTFAEIAIIAVIIGIVDYIKQHPEIISGIGELEQFIDMLIAGVLIVVAGYISLRTGISTAILELAFGSIARIVGVEPTETLAFLAEIGAIMLMFIAGTEIEFHVFKKRFKESITIGSAIFFIPLVAVMAFLSYRYGINETSLLASVALAATSAAAVYTILYDMLILYSPLGQVLFGAAIICDILSIIGLSIILGKFSLFSTLYIVLLVVLFYMVPRTGKLILALKSTWELELKIIILLLILLAIVSSALGIHATLTAFILGILIAETAKSHKSLEMKIRGLGFGFFIPIFFFYSGVLVDLTLVATNLPFFAILFIITFMSTFGGAYIASKTCCPIKYAHVLAVYNVKTSITIIVAYEGLRSGIIDPTLYSMITTTALVGAIVVSAILKIAPPSTLEDLAL